MYMADDKRINMDEYKTDEAAQNLLDMMDGKNQKRAKKMADRFKNKISSDAAQIDKAKEKSNSIMLDAKNNKKQVTKKNKGPLQNEKEKTEKRQGKEKQEIEKKQETVPSEEKKEKVESFNKQEEKEKDTEKEKKKENTEKEKKEEEKKKATVLVNPRHSNEEYTKYSFPSKTMEYMASGTPTLMAPLKCVPQEYIKHLFFFEDESVDGMKRKLEEICSKSQEELNSFGSAASDFILHNKTSKIQTGRVVEMIKRNL